MNLTDLREELAEQADRIDSRHADLLPGARRHARRTKAIRTTTAAASVAVVAFGSVLVAPNLLPADEATFDVPAAATPTPTTEQPRAPIRSVARNGQRVELSDGLFFTLQGNTWRLETTQPCSGCKSDVHRATIQPRNFGRQGVHVGWRPAGWMFTMDLVQGKASRVQYAVRIPGRATVIYPADVYQLPSLHGWTLAYVEYLNSSAIEPAGEDKNLDVTFFAYDAAGKVLPQVPPK